MNRAQWKKYYRQQRQLAQILAEEQGVILYHYWWRGRRVRSVPTGRYQFRVVGARLKSWMVMLVDIEVIDPAWAFQMQMREIMYIFDPNRP